MNLLHTITGYTNIIFGIGMALGGLGIYFYNIFGKIIPVERKKMAKMHFMTAFVLIASIVVHVLTTDKGNIFTLFAVALVTLVFLLGLSLKVSAIKSKYYNKLVALKIIFILLAALLVSVGHTYFQDNTVQFSELIGLVFPV
ncbi:MAG: hypothetical protein C0602_02760 [Denitrovibrio sp.]|nr:MAG: hypothetical protein C0602_02760 [Denitrovibrio sp.]